MRHYIYTDKTARKHQLGYAREYALSYQEWKSELADLYKKTPETASIGADTTVQEKSRKRAKLVSKMALVENAVAAAGPGIEAYLLYGVTTDGVSYKDLKNMGIPCGKGFYYSARKAFYDTLLERLD